MNPQLYLVREKRDQDEGTYWLKSYTWTFSYFHDDIEYQIEVDVARCLNSIETYACGGEKCRYDIEPTIDRWCTSCHGYPTDEYYDLKEVYTSIFDMPMYFEDLLNPQNHLYIIDLAVVPPHRAYSGSDTY